LFPQAYFFFRLAYFLLRLAYFFFRHVRKIFPMATKKLGFDILIRGWKGGHMARVDDEALPRRGNPCGCPETSRSSELPEEKIKHQIFPSPPSARRQTASVENPELSPFPFAKMHGIGNDFVVLDALRDALPAGPGFSVLAQRLCDRHFGVGGDGLLLLERATDDNAVRMRMWNPDGSEDMCGNGLRCVALLAHARAYVPDEFGVQTLAGTRRAAIVAPQTVRVSMGAPDFAPQNVPIDRAQPLINGRIELDGHIFERATCVSTGSTHTVIFGDAPVDDATFRAWSPRLEIAPLFPDRTSIMWAHPMGDNRFGIRIWERGVGETLACGTGACAVAVAARLAHRARDAVRVRSKGGELEIEWDETRNQIWKTGPATFVYEGIFL